MKPKHQLFVLETSGEKIVCLPSHPMDVRLHGGGEIKVDDVGNILEIHTSGDAVFFLFSPSDTAYTPLNNLALIPNE